VKNNRVTPAPNADRIKALRSELDAFIEQKVAEMKKTCPGVPDAFLRHEITMGSDCQCSAALKMLEKE